MAQSPESFLPLSNLALHVLIALAEGPSHGYAIIKDVESRTGGRLNIRSGALYSMIQRLHEDGLVENAPPPHEETDPRRKYYCITTLGRQVAALEADRLRDMIEAAQTRQLVPDRGAH